MLFSGRLVAATLLLVVPLSGLTRAADLRDAMPTSAYLAIWHQHNPERDYQTTYYREIWDTIQDTQIADKLLTAIRRRMSDRDQTRFDNVTQTLKEALAPVQWEALAHCTESAYAQKMEMPVSQHLLLLRFPDPEAAESLVAGIANLLRLIEQASQGNVRVEQQTLNGTPITAFVVPPEVPYQPAMGVVDGNVFVFSTSRQMLRESLELMSNPSAISKFDDPRVSDALQHLPELEDGLVFYDGKALFEQLGGLSDFITRVSNGDPQAERVSALMQDVFAQFDIIDYEITVEYTQEFQNRAATIGRIRPGAENTVLGKMFLQQQPFTDWSSWVPAEATSYSLHTGVNLHPLYQWLTETIPQHFPETQRGLDRWAALQDEYDIHLDEDILQSFSGETVSVSLPGTTQTVFGPAGQSVIYCKCDKPDRIRALIHRGIEALQQIPQVRNQGLSLKPVDGMEGFEEITFNLSAMLGMRPVYGFQDGWFVVGSHAEAVQKVSAARSGQAETIRGTDTYQQFGLDVSGTVYATSYSNIGQTTRNISAALQQVGAMLPMILGMAGASADAPELAAASDFLALLPSVGRIVGKFDFMEEKLSATLPGPTPDTYLRHTVITIRPPETEDEAATPPAR